MVVDGEVTYQIGPERKAYASGEAWAAQRDTLITEDNRTPWQARVFISYLVPKAATP